MCIRDSINVKSHSHCTWPFGCCDPHQFHQHQDNNKAHHHQISFYQHNFCACCFAVLSSYGGKKKTFYLITVHKSETSFQKQTEFRIFSILLLPSMCKMWIWAWSLIMSWNWLNHIDSHGVFCFSKVYSQFITQNKPSLIIDHPV